MRSSPKIFYAVCLCAANFGFFYPQPAIAQSVPAPTSVRKQTTASAALDKTATEATEAARGKLKNVPSVEDKLYLLDWLFYADCDAGNKQAALADLAQTSAIIPKLASPQDRAQHLYDYALALLYIGDTNKAQTTLVVARQTLMRTTPSIPAVELLCDIAVKEYRKGFLADSKESFKEALNLTDSLRPRSVATKALAKIVASRAEVSDYAGALSTLKLIEAPESRDEAAAHAATALEVQADSVINKVRYGAPGKTDEATQLRKSASEYLSKAEEFVAVMASDTYHDVCLNSLVKHYLQADRVEEAVRLADAIRKQKEGKDEIWSELATYYRDKGQFDDAKTFIAKIEREGSRSFGYRWLAEKQADGGDVAALDTARLAPSLDIRVSALCSASQTLIAKGKTVVTDAVLKECLGYATDCEAEYQRTECYIAIAGLQLYLKDTDAARETFVLAYKSAEQDNIAQADNLQSLGELQAKYGLIGMAQKTAERITDSLYKSRLLVSISKAQRIAGKADEAKATLFSAYDSARNAPRDFQSAEVMLHIGQGFYSLGDTGTAGLLYQAARIRAGDYEFTLADILIAQLKCFQFSDAVETMNKLGYSSSWDAIERVVTWADDTPTSEVQPIARKIAAKMPSPHWKARLYIKIFEEDSALESARAAYTAAMTNPDPGMSAIDLCRVSRAIFAKTKNIRRDEDAM